MLVTFEGQTCSGKSALVETVYRQLWERGVVCSASAMWPSNTDIASALPAAETADPAAQMDRVLGIVRDLYRRDRDDVHPALARGEVVLAERHLDTLIYTIAPSLGRLPAFGTQERAVVWLSLLLSQLHHKPDVTVYVDTTLPTQVERLEASRRAVYLEGFRAQNDAIATFDSYARVAHQLILENPKRFIRVDNDERPVKLVAREITAAICDRLNTTRK